MFLEKTVECKCNFHVLSAAQRQMVGNVGEMVCVEIFTDKPPLTSCAKQSNGFWIRERERPHSLLQTQQCVPDSSRAYMYIYIY